MKLLDLPEEILLRLLAVSDIEDVANVEATCAYLHKLARSRSLLLAQIQTLDFNHAPNLPPYSTVSSLSDSDLRQLIARAVRGYNNWNSPLGPKPTREEVLAFTSPVFEMRSRHSADYAMLLPGGRYFVVDLGYGAFKCYDMMTSDIVCSYSPGDYSEVTRMIVRAIDCYLGEKGDEVIVAFSGLRKGQDRDFVEVIKLDLLKGTSEKVRSHLCPPLNPDVFAEIIFTSERARVQISGDIVVAWNPGAIVVLNWRTGDSVNLEERSDLQSLDIVQGHLVCTLRLAHGDLALALTPLARLFAGPKPGPTGFYTTFLHFPLERLDVATGALTTFLALVDDISFCTPSWLAPTEREIDCPVLPLPTRVLVRVRLVISDSNRRSSSFVVFRYALERLHQEDRPVDDGDANEMMLTLQGHTSPIHSSEYFDEHGYISSTSRSGRLVSSWLGPYSPSSSSSRVLPGQRPRNWHFSFQNLAPRHYALSYEDFLNKRDSDLGAERGLRRINRADAEEAASETWFDKINVEKYSGALWSWRGNSVVVQYFD